MKVCSLDALDPKSISLTVYLVNVQKLKVWDDASEFDAEKDKARFRQYEAACDRVKNFYKEQHGKELCLIICGLQFISFSCSLGDYRKTNCRVQYPGSRKLQELSPRPDGHLAGYGDARHPCGRV
jgi:hypothetical protein